MARTTPAVLIPSTPITADLWNDQVGDNLNHLLGLTANSVALTDLSGGGEIVQLSKVGGVSTIQTRTTTGMFTTLDLTTLEGYANAYDVEISFSLRSNAAATNDNMQMVLNGDVTAANYYNQRAGSNDGSALIGENSDASMSFIIANNGIQNTFSQGNFRVYDFKNSAIFKSIPVVVGGMHSTTISRLDLGIISYRVLSAITTINLGLATGTGFMTHSNIKVRFIV